MSVKKPFVHLAYQQVTPVLTIAQQAEQAFKELNTVLNQAGDLLGYVSAMSPLFDLNELRKEGNTDISKLDLNLMTAIGNRVIENYKRFNEDYNVLKTDMKALEAELLSAQTAIDKLFKQQDVLLQCTGQHFKCITWMEDYNLVVIALLTDLINHLNTARAPEVQLQKPQQFMESVI